MKGSGVKAAFQSATAIVPLADLAGEAGSWLARRTKGTGINHRCKAQEKKCQPLKEWLFNQAGQEMGRGRARGVWLETGGGLGSRLEARAPAAYWQGGPEGRVGGYMTRRAAGDWQRRRPNWSAGAGSPWACGWPRGQHRAGFYTLQPCVRIQASAARASQGAPAGAGTGRQRPASW